MIEKRTPNAWQTLWTLAVSVLSAMAFAANLGRSGIKQIIAMNGVTGLIVVAAFFAFYTLMRAHAPGRERRAHWTGAVCAAIFAGIMLVGKAITVSLDLKPLYSSWSNLLASAVVLAGCFAFFERLLDFAYAYLSRPREGAEDIGILKRLFPDSASTLRVAAIILVCWLPYVLANFPGGLTGDMPDQVGQFLGHETYTSSLSPAIDEAVTLNTMNPVAHTVLLGALVKLFMRGNDIVFGVFAFCLLQVVCFALVCARSIVTMRRCSLSRGFRLGALAFYCFNPMIPLFSFSTVKDTAFSLLLLLVLLLLVETHVDPGKALASPLRVGALVGSILLFILFRNSAIYIAVAIVPMAYLAIAGGLPKGRIKPRAILACALVAPILLSMLISGVVYPAFRIRTTTTREDKSLMFQQTARYAIQYADEVTEAERAAVSAVLAFDRFAEIYNPRQADNVKATFNESVTQEQLDAYYRVWLAQFKKHPLSYLETFVSMSYMYTYPELRLDDYLLKFYPVKTKTYQYPDAAYKVSVPQAVYRLSKLTGAGIRLLSSVPAVGALFNLGLYAWAVVAMAFLALRAKARVGLLLVPLIALWIGLGFTPVNGSFRYGLGLVTACPIVLTIGIYAVRHPGKRAAQTAA